MVSKVEIGIFCVGQTKVDRDEVKRWLDFLGVQEFTLPEDNAISNPALLIALAAKRCYKSFDTTLNPNLSRVRSDYAEYLDNVLKSGHGSVLEHSVYNFAIENVSRVFTGEMNRHRAGWAISEGSMRFIRFSDAVPYWEPNSIRGPDVITHPGIKYCLQVSPLEELVDDHIITKLSSIDEKKHVTRILFERSFNEQRYLYKVLETVWKEELAPTSKFSEKKNITSMMRRIIGMGVATGGVWSGNIRAVRHVMTMRCEPAAEEEILHVFSRITMMMKEREPLMFGDFAKDDLGFWRPKYKKV